MQRKPTWGTCAGLILLAEAANRTKKGGQDLIGGIDVRVRRNYYGRQVESFETQISLPFLKGLNAALSGDCVPSFKGVFIRAPVVERILPHREGIQIEEADRPETIVAPSKCSEDRAVERAVAEGQVEVMATLSKRRVEGGDQSSEGDSSDIIAVRQGNCFGLSFHPELTDDPRIHIWWLKQVEAGLLVSEVG